jgi:acylphosphatase
MKTIRIKIYGHVQGVFYRLSTKEKAKELDINGFILNEPDGAVFIEAQGEEKKLTKLIDWCKIGPEYARVDNIEYQVAPQKKKYKSFKIIYNYPN